MNKTHKTIAAIGLIGIIAVAAVILWHRNPGQSSIREALGHAFNRPVELIALNLPPADGRYPGAVIVEPQPGQVLPLRRVYRPGVLPDNSAIRLKIKMAREAAAALASRFVGNTASSGDLAVDVVFDNLRLFEVDLNERFKRGLLGDEDVYRAEKRGLKPQVIVRTYEAVLSLNVRRAGSLSAEAWKKIKVELVRSGGRFADADTVALKSDRPVAVAYEAVTVNYVATSLSAGRPDEIELRDAFVENAASGQLNLSAFDLSAGALGVQYALLGNSRYKSDNFPNLRAVEPSIQVVGDLFQNAGADPLQIDQSPHVVTETAMNDTLSRITEKLGATAPSLFVLYYVGHAVAGAGGQLYLVMNDYDGDPVIDLGKNLMLELPRAQLDEPSSSLEGSNINDLLDVITALQTELPPEMKGLYPVSTIAKQLEDTGTPFVILIDACFEVEQMDRLRETFNLTESGDYYGPDDHGGPQEVERYANAIRQFGTSPYLNSANVVVFSAVPGTFAIVVPDTRPTWGITQYVGPLASRMHRRFEAALTRSQPMSWGDFLQSIVDVKALGEVRIHGSVSWSDFGVARQIPMLQE